TGWQPAEAVAFAGALRYSAYNLLLRWVMRRIARKAAAHLPGATDTSRDHEYTDWAAVDAFADAFAHRLVAAEAQEPAAVRRSEDGLRGGTLAEPHEERAEVAALPGLDLLR